MYKSTGRMLRECPPRVYLDAVRSQGSHYVPLGSMPPEVRDIFVTREDVRFYRHQGIVPGYMLESFKYSIREHEPLPGGSTITQQLMKNLYFNCERSVVRKIREAALAIRVECSSMLTKDEILELYLNCVRYGPDVYGLADAAEYFFGKTADALTRNQAVILATVAVSPYWRRPVEDPVAFTKDRNETLIGLVACGAMSPLEAKEISHVYNPLVELDPELRSLSDIYGMPGEKKTPDGLVRFARAMTGSPYWKGAFGLTAVLGLLNHLRWDWPDEYESTDYLGDLGKRVFDDAGLVKAYLWSASADSLPLHDRERDWTAAELYEHASGKGSMESFDRKNGRLLYTVSSQGIIDHVGIYSAEDLVYHAKDRAHGVMCEPFRAGDWACWSHLPAYDIKKK